MNNMQARIKEIQDRLNNATAGTWHFNFKDRSQYGNKNLNEINSITTVNIVQDVWKKNDAEFIAHARQDIPYLLAELQKAQTESGDIPNLIKYTEKAQAEIASKTRMLNLANGALKRAGSAAQFGIKRDIPEGALVFKDSAESMANIPDDYCGCEELTEAQARKQVFKKALEKIISFTKTLPYNINGIEEVNRIANEALKEGQA